MDRSDVQVEDVVVLTSTAVDKARLTLVALQRLHDAGHIRLSAGAVVGRRPDGRSFAVEQEARHSTATAGTTVGATPDLSALLTGPFGVVLESAPDALVGSLVDIADRNKSDRLLRCFGSALPAGCIATIAIVTEYRPESIHGVAARLDVGVVRRPREEVEEDVGGDVVPAPAPHGGRIPGALGRMRAAVARRAGRAPGSRQG